MVGEGGLEPPTFHLSRIYSPLPSPLGYSPVLWWVLPESNQRRPALQAGALPSELRTHDSRGDTGLPCKRTSANVRPNYMSGIS